MDLEEIGYKGVDSDSTGSSWGPIVGFCEYDNKRLSTFSGLSSTALVNFSLCAS
jgi:hypothetical protein